MKNWILSHKILSIVLACAIGVGAICAVVLPIALRHKHEFSAEWSYDDTDHFHKCLDENCKTVSDKAAHVFDKEVVADKYIVAKATYTEAAKYYKSCLCGVKGTEIFNSGSSLSAKDNVINLKEGVTLGKTYDGEAYKLTAEEITRNGEGAITFMYKLKDSEAEYTETAPKKAGEYTVKVTVAATPEWKETAKTFDYAINPKPLNATANKVYDGNTNIEVTLDGVCEGDDVSASITMSSKNVGATVKEITLAGEDKDNYEIDKTMVSVSITPIVITVEWGKEYDNSNIFKGEPTKRLEGDEVTVTVTMDSANVGASVQSVALTGKDAGNYSLAREDVTAEIVKADIDFEISNASAFTEFFVGATNIPDPVTNYKEIGTGYGAKTIVWEKRLKGGVWSRTLTKEEVRNEKTGTYQVRVQYAEGTNYNFAATEYVGFTVNAKPRSLTVKNFDGKTYDGKQVTNFTFDNLVKKFGATTPDGVENFTSAMESGEKYVEFREVGGEWGRNLNVANVLTNAAEYEYRIGVTATDEWAAVVSEVKTFTIKPYEFVLELGYGQNQNNESLDGGKTFILRQYENLIEGQKIQLWLDNEKAGLEIEGRSSVFHFIPDQKKKVTTDCFFLKIGNISNPVMENYKIVPKYPNVTTVEMTVVEYTTEKSTSGSIIMVQPAENWIRTNVEKGYFKVGQTVVVYKKVIVDGSATYVKAGEATITEIRAGGTTSASGFAIPSDGTVIIVLDKIYDDILSGKIEVK
mgnify:CR=1 FL=1